VKRIKNTFLKSFFKASFIAVFFVLSLMIIPTKNVQPVHASPQDDLKTVESQLQTTNQNLENKKSEIKTLGDQLNTLTDQIYQTELQIEATGYKIKIIDEQIIQTEIELKKQKEILNEYMRVIYEESNTSTLELVAGSDSFSDFVDRSEYLQTMQIKIKDTVQRVKGMKEELENKRKENEKLKDQLASQKTELNNKRAGKNTLLILAQQNKDSLQQDANQLISKKGVLYCQIYGGCEGDINGNLIATNTSPYYNQADPQWINYAYDPGNTLGDYGCLITSLAMVRTSFGTSTNPIQEAGLHSYSGGNMQGWDFAGKPKKDVTGNWNAINMALDTGKPVIVGLRMSSGYSTHFVVIMSHSGDTYYINDPYFPAGQKYSSSRIFSAVTTY